MATSLDLTPYSNMTQQQFISSVHHLTAVPSIIFLWIITIVVLICCGFTVNNKAKYYGIIALVAISTGILAVCLVFLPNAIHLAANFLKSFFG